MTNPGGYVGRLVRKKRTGHRVVQLKCPRDEGWIDLGDVETIATNPLYLGREAISHECGWTERVNLSLWLRLPVPNESESLT